MRRYSFGLLGFAVSSQEVWHCGVWMRAVEGGLWLLIDYFRGDRVGEAGLVWPEDLPKASHVRVDFGSSVVTLPTTRMQPRPRGHEDAPHTTLHRTRPRARLLRRTSRSHESLPLPHWGAR
eukprot:7380959-Prymnesium_polylepis.1